MAINDSSESRIKAKAARTVMELQGGQEIFVHLHGLMNAHGLKAITAIDLTAGDDVAKHTNAHTDGDRDVLHDYITGVVRHELPDDIKDRRGAVILAIRDDGVIDLATWGKTNDDCTAIGAWGADLMDRLPKAPFTTWFGWGYGGRPQKLKPSEMRQLGKIGRSYAERYTHPRAT